MKIYCSGIGGIGLSAYAALQAAQGNEVSGSDRADSALLQQLREQGIMVHLQQDGTAVPTDIDLFVYSEAIPPTAPERQRATELGVEQLSYFAALGRLTADYRLITVCGTHGKSSTTAMLAKVLVDAGLDPTVVVGTKVPDLGGRNWRSGKSDLCLVEACEYRRSFHYLRPDIVIMANVDGDHFDAYDSLEDYQQSFAEFLALLPADGQIVTHGNDADCVRLAEASGRAWHDADTQTLLPLLTPGLHMQQNAQLAAETARLLDVPQETIQLSLGSFAGTWRRGELKGHYQDVPVIDDYGHHPHEVAATLAAFRSAYPDKRLVCVFQPHMHNRTLALYQEFMTAFREADLLIIPDIYDARHDTETELVDVDTFLVDIARQSGCQTRNGGSLQATEALLREEILQSGDLLLCMGAGDITKLAEAMVA